MSESLHIVTCVANPINWESRTRLARAAIKSWQDAGAKVTLVECSYGNRAYELSDLKETGVNYVPVRAYTLVWNKECLLNIGIRHLPPDAKYIGTFDADVKFRNPAWVANAINAMQLYPVIQPWSDAYDLGPNDQHIQSHKSFARMYHGGHPVCPYGPKWWTFDQGPYDYPHSGYAWIWLRQILDWIGGLFELGGMGSGDHHMALGIAGKAEKSMPAGVNKAYAAHVYRWQDRAQIPINGKLGFCWGTLEHPFHGLKVDRKYIGRWEMFVKHQFNPDTDLKRNTYGVLEFAGNKPDLERDFDNYLRQRREDINTL